MNKLYRITQLKRILETRRTPIPLRTLMEAMECSESTARRLLYSYRDDFGAPILFDRSRNGWYLTGSRTPQEELPGNWLTPSELHALLSARELLRQLEPSLLAEATAPIATRIERLLAERGIGPPEIARRIRLIPIGARVTAPDVFIRIARCVLDRQRLRLRYHNRGRAPEPDEDGRTPEREVSPQRLLWYRGNWYLDAWCHRVAGLRRFAMERITEPETQSEPAMEVPDEQLDAALGAQFGIFAGPVQATAVLRFTAHRARWVAEECWHPKQEACWLADGRYQLSLPYGADPELIMDILKYGPDCEVVAPASLREAVKARLRETLAIYQDDES